MNYHSVMDHRSYPEKHDLGACEHDGVPWTNTDHLVCIGFIIHIV